MNQLPRNTIMVGDAFDKLSELPTDSIDAAITSPPYFGLRDFGKGHIGQEATVDLWVERLRPIFAQLRRVLKPEGSAWLNVGDTYSSDPKMGAPRKSLVLAPERLLLALAADGWIVRAKCVWHKPNAVPRHATDRPNPSYDVLFLLTKSARYYFALDLIRERRADGWLGKKPADVWVIPSQAGVGGHNATFPPELVRRPLLASCPERICERCGRPWAHDVQIEKLGRVLRQNRDAHVLRYPSHYEVRRLMGPLRPACACEAPWRPGVAIDPFAGTGTTAVVAQQFRRDFILIEKSPHWARVARERLGMEPERPLITPERLARAA